MASERAQFEEKKIVKTYDVRILKRLLPFVRPYRILLLCSLFLIFLVTLLELSVPYVTKIAIDRYIVPKVAENNAGADRRHVEVHAANPEIGAIVDRYPDLFEKKDEITRIAFEDLSKLDKEEIAAVRGKDMTGVAVAAAVLLFIILVEFVLNFFREVLMELAGQRIMHDLRMRLFSHIMDLSVSFFNHNPVGRLVTRVTNDIQNMDELFTSIIVFVLKDVFLMAGIVCVLLYLNWKLTLATFAVLPVVLLAAIHFSKLVREVFRDLRIKIAEINTRFSETIGGIGVIQLFRQEDRNREEFEDLNHSYYIAAMKQLRIFAVFMPLVEMMGVIAVALIIFQGGRGVLSQEITIGALVAFISYMKMFFRPIRDIAEKYNIMQNAMASAERIFLIFDSDEKLPIPDNPKIRRGEAVRSVELNHVSFHYTEGETVLRDICLNIRAGDTIAVVGPTGSGKTSLIQLIMRFYDPVQGEVLINGLDIREWEISAIREKTALVTQDPYLFSDTIKNNIFGKSHTESEIRDILEASNCKPFIDRLPDGIDTVLSEGGGSVSSGERQLLSIARAFAKDPQLIILDEATSYIDSETESKVQKALTNLMRDRTSIIIAHRLSTARNADTIHVLNKGGIVESGSHAELMKNRGFYYRMNQMKV